MNLLRKNSFPRQRVTGVAVPQGGVMVRSSPANAGPVAILLGNGSGECAQLGMNDRAGSRRSVAVLVGGVGLAWVLGHAEAAMWSQRGQASPAQLKQLTSRAV